MYEFHGGGVEIHECFVITKEMVFDQMVYWKFLLLKLNDKEKRLRHNIAKAEETRRRLRLKNAGNKSAEEFFIKLSRMYDRLAEIPRERREAEERLVTLRFSENWN